MGMMVLKVSHYLPTVVFLFIPYGFDDWGVAFRISIGSILFTSPYSPSSFEVTQSPIQWYWGFVLGSKVGRAWTDHSPPTRSEVKEMWIYASTPLNAFMA
jgi:hypothetical protein